LDKFTTKGKEKIEEDNLKTYGHIDQDLNLQEDNELIDETDYRKHADINGDWLDMLNEKNVMMTNVLKENEEFKEAVKELNVVMMNALNENEEVSKQNGEIMKEMAREKEEVLKEKSQIDQELHDMKELMQSLLKNLKKN